MSVGGGDAGLPRVGEMLSSLDVAGKLLPVVPAGGGGGSSSVGAANPAGPDGPVVAGGPVGPCGKLSTLSHDVIGPLEHSILDHAGPAGQHVAVGSVGLLGSCPHLTITLLARMLQGALLAQMRSLKFWIR